MDPSKHCFFESGRVLLCRLPAGNDVAASITDICTAHGIKAARFNLGGALASVTVGVYDQKQQVYVTHTETTSLEIVSAMGNVSMKNGTPYVHATITLADQSGKIIGGRLFSPSRIFAVEMTLQEFTGHPLERTYDKDTGLDLWVE